MFADAEAYERFMGRWSRLVAPPLVDFAGLAAHGRFLDIGSGTGALAFAIGERRPDAEILGIDPSKEYVAYAGSKNALGARVSFEVGDAQRMTFGDATFDAAVSLLVFNFIPDPRKALREVRRIVKAGASVTAAVWDYGAGMQMLRTFWDAAVAMDPGAEKLDEKHMPLCRSGELSALWRESGLQDVEERPIEVTTTFASFADYWEPFLLGQGPAGAYVGRLGKEKTDALREEVRRRLRAGDDPIRLTARVWAVRGRR
jgi:SAM-dependent methyltransferase